MNVTKRGILLAADAVDILKGRGKFSTRGRRLPDGAQLFWGEANTLLPEDILLAELQRVASDGGYDVQYRHQFLNQISFVLKWPSEWYAVAFAVWRLYRKLGLEQECFIEFKCPLTLNCRLTVDITCYGVIPATLKTPMTAACHAISDRINQFAAEMVVSIGEVSFRSRSYSVTVDFGQVHADYLVLLAYEFYKLSEFVPISEIAGCTEFS